MMSYTTLGTDPKTPISYHKDIFTSTFIDALSIHKSKEWNQSSHPSTDE